MKQCMDADNLHRRLRKIVGQVQAIDRMVDEDIPCEPCIRWDRLFWRVISSIVYGMESPMEIRIR